MHVQQQERKILEHLLNVIITLLVVLLAYVSNLATVVPPIPPISGLTKSGGIRKLAVLGVIYNLKTLIWDLEMGGGIGGGGGGIGRGSIGGDACLRVRRPTSFYDVR